jgi:hypothetical protein
MKKTIRVFAVLLACVMLSAVFAFSTSAASNVTYNGNAGTFIFAPGSEHSPTDLFADFKGVMPGDEITQQIFIDNDVDNGVKVTLYMRALGETEGADSNGFLEQLTITVAAKDGEELFKAPANEPAPVDDWVCLGTFYSGAAVTLDVTLHFPIEAGDDTQNAVGFVDWEFKAEEYPPEPDDPTPTGDNTRIAIFACIAIVAVVAVIAVEIKQRRREA